MRAGTSTSPHRFPLGSRSMITIQITTQITHKRPEKWSNIAVPKEPLCSTLLGSHHQGSGHVPAGGERDASPAGASETTGMAVMRRVARFIHSPGFQNFLTLLLLIDVLITMALLEVETEYPACDSALAVCKSSDHGCKDDPLRVHDAKIGLSRVSQLILVIFSTEMVLLILSVGWRFFKEPLYVFDFMIVVTSVALELTIGRRHHVSGLLVFARAWRFISLLHSMDSIRRMRIHIDLDDEEDQEESRRHLSEPLSAAE